MCGTFNVCGSLHEQNVHQENTQKKPENNTDCNFYLSVQQQFGALREGGFIHSPAPPPTPWND